MSITNLQHRDATKQIYQALKMQEADETLRKSITIDIQGFEEVYHPKKERNIEVLGKDKLHLYYSRESNVSDVNFLFRVAKKTNSFIENEILSKNQNFEGVKATISFGEESSQQYNIFTKIYDSNSSN